MARRTIGTIGVLAAAVLALTSCSSSHNHPETVTTITATATSLAPVVPTPITAAPAAGEKLGVIPRRDNTYALDWWKCAPDLTETQVSLEHPRVELNGTIIELSEHDLASTEAPRTGPAKLQGSVTLRFSGRPIAATSMIVKSSDGYSWYGTESEPINPAVFKTSPDDEKIVNLTPEMIAAGVHLPSIDFVDGLNYIARISVCTSQS